MNEPGFDSPIVPGGAIAARLAVYAVALGAELGQGPARLRALRARFERGASIAGRSGEIARFVEAAWRQGAFGPAALDFDAARLGALGDPALRAALERVAEVVQPLAWEPEARGDQVRGG